jgi:protein-ribulosamine 3-kinase
MGTTISTCSTFLKRARRRSILLSWVALISQLNTNSTRTLASVQRDVVAFPVMTCVGRTPQNNSWSRSWPKFFAENRLRPVCKLVEKNHGVDIQLTSLLDRIVQEVVPRLLGNGHLGSRKGGVQPALVHGDLWSGNKARGRVGGKGGIEEVTFDAGSCYAHSEYDLGIMRMFGGFSAGFFNEYHRLIPKSEPKNEYDDRLALYEL